MTDSPPPAGPSPSPSSGVGDGPAERTRTVAVRLTDAEHSRWRAAAEVAGRAQLGRFARETIAAVIEGRREPVRIEGLADMRADLSHAGSNLNQVARALNIANQGGPDGPDLAMVVAVIAETREVLGEIRDQLQQARPR